MNKTNDYEKYSQEIQRGLLVVAVLQVVSVQRLYASEIIQKLQSTSYKTQEGTLYPLLSKMKREGLLRHEWVESTSGPPRKYYSLSQDGEQLRKSLIRNIDGSTKSLKALREAKGK